MHALDNYKTTSVRGNTYNSIWFLTTLVIQLWQPFLTHYRQLYMVKFYRICQIALKQKVYEKFYETLVDELVQSAQSTVMYNTKKRMRWYNTSQPN